MTPDPDNLDRNLRTPDKASAPPISESLTSETLTANLLPADSLAPAWGQGELAGGGLVQPAPGPGPSALVRRVEDSLGVSLRGQALILAIGASVVLVTLGQLQAFAVHENQRDARSLVARLGPALAAARAAHTSALAGFQTPKTADVGPAGPVSLSLASAGAFDLRTLGTLADAGLERLGDLHWLPTPEVPGGHLAAGADSAGGAGAGWRLKRHGYVFALGSDGGGQLWLSAWPWEYGRSGREAYAWCSERGELRFANRSGLLSGPAAVPEPERAGWVRR